MIADIVLDVQRTDGGRTTGLFIGDALRRCRRAAELNLLHGPTPGVAASIGRAREALDGVAWLCEYTASEGNR